MRTLMVVTTALFALGSATTMASAQVGSAGSERFVLSGLVVFDEGEGVAWLQEPSLTQNRVVVLRRGESVGPWKLTRILDNRVELEGPAGTVLIPLQNAGAGGTTVASGAPGVSSPAAPGLAAVPGLAAAPGPAGTAAPSFVVPSHGAVPSGSPSAGSASPSAEAPSGQGGSTAGSEAQAPTNPAPRPSGALSFPVGDPRRRENMRQLFGPR